MSHANIEFGYEYNIFFSYSLIPQVNKVETHKLYIVNMLSRNCSNCLNLLCMKHNLLNWSEETM